MTGCQLAFGAYMPWHLHQVGSRVYILIPCVLALLAGDEYHDFLFVLRCGGAIHPLGLGDTSLAPTSHG